MSQKERAAADLRRMAATMETPAIALRMRALAQELEVQAKEDARRVAR